MDEYKEKLFNMHRKLVKAGEFKYAQNLLYLMGGWAMRVFNDTYKSVYEYVYNDVRYYRFR